MELSERIALAISKSGKDSKEIAAACGVSPSAVSQWLSGLTKNLKPQSLYGLAVSTGTRMEWLAVESGPMMSGEAFPDPVSLPEILDGQEMIFVPRYEVTASMGSGRTAHPYPDVIDLARINAEYLRLNVSYTAIGNLALITGLGDSMEGTFNDGDVLLIDRGVTDVKLDAVYVLSLNGELYVKRLQRRPDGALIMISDNSKYEPYVIKQEERSSFRVEGRVLLAWNARKL